MTPAVLIAQLAALVVAIGCNTILGFEEGQEALQTTDPRPGGSGGQAGQTGQAGGGAGATGGSAGSIGTGGGGGATPVCGNGFIEGAEECDDSNVVPGDGCDGCRVECDQADQLHLLSTHHCYWLTEAVDSWDTVRAECVLAGADLATITSTAELVGVQQFVTIDAYLGASDRDTEGTFAWVTGEAWGFDNWAAGEPNDSGAEDCVQWLPSGQWNDFECDGQLPGLCERPVQGQPAANRSGR